MEKDCSNKTYVVTGATSGIGLAAAEALVVAGATVIGVGRSAERCRGAEKHLNGLKANGRALYFTANLGVQEEVNRLAEKIAAQQAGQGQLWLDGLVNNAGIFTYWLTLTPDGIETQWAVNHLAAFLLTQRLLPLLRAAPTARVVTVSSASHYGARLDWNDVMLRRHYNCLRAYGNTKLANILFTLELNRRLAGCPNLRAFAADPGLVKTDMGLKGTPSMAGWVWKLRRSGGTAPEIPARSILYLLAEPSIQDSPHVYWKEGRPKQPSRHALDTQAAARLWALSEQMCGLHQEVTHESH